MFVTFSRGSVFSTSVFSEKMLEGRWQRPFVLESALDHVILLLRTIPTRLENSHFASPTAHDKHVAFLLQLKENS
jgi:hypothetical protein